MNLYELLLTYPLLIPPGIFAGWAIGEMYSDVRDGHA